MDAAAASFEGKLWSYRDDRDGTVFILTLSNPACGPDGKPVDELHVVANDKTISLANFDRKKVTIEGAPFAEHTAHHHRPIVVEVKKASAQAAAINLPGNCVDAKADATRRAKKHSHEAALLDDAVDLDGDGTRDLVFGVSAGGVNTSMLLYVARGSCAHFVGEVDGNGIRPAAATHAGLADLTVEDTSHCEGAPPPCVPKKTSLRFDGTTYVAPHN
jgi:hypothetical protein